MNKNTRDTLNKYYPLAKFMGGALVTILVLNFFFYWEPSDSDALSRSILYNGVTDTYNIDGNASVENVLSGDGSDPIEILEDMVFLSTTSVELFKFYALGNTTEGPDIPDVMEGGLVIETVGTGVSFVQTTFWDGVSEAPTLTLSNGTTTRASIFESSVIIGIGTSTRPSTYNTCLTQATSAGIVLVVDCSRAVEQADLLVIDDVQIGGDLTVGGTINKPMAKVTKSVDQSIPNNTLTMVTWDEEKYDTDDMHSTSTNNTRITFNTSGIYSGTIQAEWGINSGGFRFLEVKKNGGGPAVARSRYSADNASERTASFTEYFEVDDYIELEVFQDSGGNLDFESGTSVINTYLEVHKID